MVAAENILAEAPERAGTRPRAGAIREFFLVGGATPVLFAASWLARRHLALDACDLTVGFTMFYAAYVIDDPHFAVTYILFSATPSPGCPAAPLRRRSARYLLAGVVVPLALGAWALVAIATKSARERLDFVIWRRDHAETKYLFV